MFNIFSLRSGGTYLIQVRCKPIHGFWSEWSPPVNVTAPYGEDRRPAGGGRGGVGGVVLGSNPNVRAQALPAPE